MGFFTVKYKNLIDLHLHSLNSDDGFDPVMKILSAGYDCGLVAASITDHCECQRYRRDGFDRFIRQSFADTLEARENFAGKMKVLLGMELGQAMQDLTAAEDALGANDYDFVIGSLHNVKGEADFWCVDYKTKDAAKLLHVYYDEMLELIEWGKFDTLAHINYPLRYIIGVEHIELNLNEYATQIDNVLSALAKSGKALEVNTSGLRQPYGRLLPDVDIITRFRELGGKYVTIGSDAHHDYDVGKGIVEGFEAIKQSGFDCVTYFENRKPVELIIE